MSMPAASKMCAVTASYAVSMVSRSPRSFASRRWCTRTRFGVWLIRCSCCRSVSCFAPGSRDGESSVAAERQRGHLGAQRVLPALPLGAVDEGEHLVDDGRVETAGEELGPALRVLDVGVEHLVEQVVRRQRVLVD